MMVAIGGGPITPIVKRLLVKGVTLVILKIKYIF